MELKFEPFILILYNIFKEYVSSYNEIIWEYYRQDESEDYYTLYEQEFFGKENVRIKRETKKHIINACLYVNKVVIPAITEVDDFETLYLATKEKLQRCKFNWRTQVEKYLKNKDTRKYILKEYEELEEYDHDIDTFKKKRLRKIKEWEKDDNTLLSEFYYTSDLIKKQLNIIAKDEGIYIILNSALKENNISLLNYLRTIKYNLDKEKSKNMGATVPDSMFQFDSMFLTGNKNINDFKYQEGQNNIVVTPDANNKNFQVLIPKFEVDDNLKITFNYQESNISNTAYDFKNLVAIFEIGSSTLLKGIDTITFTMKEVCNHLNIIPCTRNYNSIANTLYHFKIKTYKFRISDTHERIFNIIDSIDKPILNSNRELEWSVKISEVLVQEILDAKYKRIYINTLSSFRYELSILLFRILIGDFETSKKDVLRYSWSNIAKRTAMPGKPNKIKKRIVSALDEILAAENSIIKNYFTPHDNSYFEIYKSQPIV